MVNLCFREPNAVRSGKFGKLRRMIAAIIATIGQIPIGIKAWTNSVLFRTSSAQNRLNPHFVHR